MDPFSVQIYAAAIPAVLVAGISKGGFGSGAAFAGAVILALAVEPPVALAVMLPLLMVMDVTALPAYWRRWDPVAAVALCAGAVPGVIVAGLVFRSADPDTLRILIGAVALGFVAFQLARQSGVLDVSGLPAGRAAGWFWGCVAGFTSFVSHAGGPPAAVYLLSRGLTKETYQATTVVVFWIINMMKIGPYAWLGAFSAQTLWLDLTLIPVAVAGIGLGVWLHRRVASEWYFRVTYALLVVTGTKLIWDGLA
ncbi:Sulfite exporter TauE/SafE [Rhodobacteraceae bacterium THAF1]|uniref:sulfite exporter TauE/SafE family protein n=1 Tax=Palleronia sp. THAF1 TaxID=2587842 RepID=UPI000F41C140|nr:sulfite exporter TauE/SafE family protein [Palleronia sp. THAF1]QFU07852.1 Sulfite exporter TauE/SafE [Palleronia sp. THAF1]VDC25686.1 Sulfite exporter TauE/SafE [Rhodobacteraceae bacterium THAF1]